MVHHVLLCSKWRDLLSGVCEGLYEVEGYVSYLNSLGLLKRSGVSGLL